MQRHTRASAKRVIQREPASSLSLSFGFASCAKNAKNVKQFSMRTPAVESETRVSLRIIQLSLNVGRFKAVELAFLQLVADSLQRLARSRTELFFPDPNAVAREGRKEWMTKGWSVDQRRATSTYHFNLSLAPAEKVDDLSTSPISSRQKLKLFIVHM